ncbi:hypothetical protein ES707_18763 [subsurface metagenome]
MPGEERRISPAVLIIPVGLGLGLAAALGIGALAAPTRYFSNESVYGKACPIATAYQVPVFDCRISNVTDETITRRMTLWQHGFSYGYMEWRDPIAIESFEVTLKPGASYDYHYDGYGPHCDAEWCCNPQLDLYYAYYYWLEDELGNKSSEVSIYIPPS